MKFLKNHMLPLLAAAGGITVMILRYCHLATANENGLLASGHFAGILAGVLCLLIPALLLWRRLVLPKKSTGTFPASLLAVIGYGIGGLGLAISSVLMLVNQPDNMETIAGFAGLVAAVALGLLAGLRYRGKGANVLLHTAICLHFILLLICQYRLWSSEPQLALYACPLLATVCLMLAAYHRACFEVQMGRPRAFVFYRGLSLFFCLAAIPGSSFWILYLTAAVWSAADLLNLSLTAEEVQ